MILQDFFYYQFFNLCKLLDYGSKKKKMQRCCLMEICLNFRSMVPGALNLYMLTAHIELTDALFAGRGVEGRGGRTITIFVLYWIKATGHSEG